MTQRSEVSSSCPSSPLTQSTRGESMKEASSSDRVTSMTAAAPAASSPSISHQATINPPDRSVDIRSGLAVGQNKAPARHRSPPARALSLSLSLSRTTIVSRCPVSPNTAFKHFKASNMNTNCWKYFPQAARSRFR